MEGKTRGTMRSLGRSVRWRIGLLGPALALAVGASAAGPPPAPVTIAPGDPQVDGSFIRPARNRWSVLSLSIGDVRDTYGSWTDEIEVVEREGRPVIRRTQVDAGKQGTVRFVDLTDQRTLRPISAEIDLGEGRTNRWRFAEGVVHITATHPGADGKPAVRELDVKLSQPVFDFNGGMFGLLLAGFPLREGFSCRLPVFSPKAEGGLAWVTYTVIGRELVPAGGGKKLEAWTVEAKNSTKGDVMVFSLTKSPPYVLRLRQVAEGVVYTYDMT